MKSKRVLISKEQKQIQEEDVETCREFDRNRAPFGNIESYQKKYHDEIKIYKRGALPLSS